MLLKEKHTYKQIHVHTVVGTVKGGKVCFLLIAAHFYYSTEKKSEDAARIALINRLLQKEDLKRLESKSFRHQLGLLAHFQCLYYHKKRWNWGLNFLELSHPVAMAFSVESYFSSVIHYLPNECVINLVWRSPFPPLRNRFPFF